MGIVVSDTSPIRALAHLDRLDLLGLLFEMVLVSPAVVAELLRSPAGLPVVDLRGVEGVVVRAPGDGDRVAWLRERLDPGESEALALALEVTADAVLIDEAAGRAEARRLGLRPLGVLGVLILARQRGVLGSLAPLLGRLEKELGFFLSSALKDEILRRVQE